MNDGKPPKNPPGDDSMEQGLQQVYNSTGVLVYFSAPVRGDSSFIAVRSTICRRVLYCSTVRYGKIRRRVELTTKVGTSRAITATSLDGRIHRFGDDNTTLKNAACHSIRVDSTVSSTSTKLGTTGSGISVGIFRTR